MTPKVSIIIVSWNTRELLRQCLRSVYDETHDVAFEIFVVDNASKDGTPEMVEAEFKGVLLLRNHENLGFARANNQAIRKSTGKYALLLNPDTVILGDVLGRMINVMDRRPRVGMSTCTMFNPDMTFQACFATFPTFGMVLLGGSTPTVALQSLFLTKRFFKTAGYRPKVYEQPNRVDWIMGAFMMVRREAISEAGLLDENLFMYGEEPDWCYRMARLGWEIWYYPEKGVIHYGGQSTKQRPLKDEVSWLMTSQYRFFGKHRGQAYLTSCFVVGVVGSALKLVLFLILKHVPLGAQHRAYAARKVAFFREVLKWHASNPISSLMSSARVATNGVEHSP